MCCKIQKVISRMKYIQSEVSLCKQLDVQQMKTNLRKKDEIMVPHNIIHAVDRSVKLRARSIDPIPE